MCRAFIVYDICMIYFIQNVSRSAHIMLMLFLMSDIKSVKSFSFTSQSLSLFCSCLVIVVLLFTGKRAALLGRTLVVAWKLSDLIWSQHNYSISIMFLSEREGNRRRRRGGTRRCVSDITGAPADKGLFYVSRFVTGFFHTLSKHEITFIFLRMYLDTHQLTEENVLLFIVSSVMFYLCLRGFS